MRYGCALRQLADPNEMIEVPGVGDRGSRAAVAPDARRSDRAARRGAVSRWCSRSCAQSGFEELLSSGIVLTGGSAVMQGMVELGEEIFHMPVRLGVPHYAGGLAEVVRNPRYATAVGLLLEGAVAGASADSLRAQGGSVQADARSA